MNRLLFFCLQEPGSVSLFHSVWCRRHRSSLPALQAGCHLAGAATHHLWWVLCYNGGRTSGWSVWNYQKMLDVHPEGDWIPISIFWSLKKSSKSAEMSLSDFFKVLWRAIHAEWDIFQLKNQLVSALWWTNYVIVTLLLNDLYLCLTFQTFHYLADLQ